MLGSRTLLPKLANLAANLEAIGSDFNITALLEGNRIQFCASPKPTTDPTKLVFTPRFADTIEGHDAQRFLDDHLRTGQGCVLDDQHVFDWPLLRGFESSAWTIRRGLS